MRLSFFFVNCTCDIFSITFPVVSVRPFSSDGIFFIARHDRRQTSGESRLRAERAVGLQRSETIASKLIVHTVLDNIAERDAQETAKFRVLVERVIVARDSLIRVRLVRVLHFIERHSSPNAFFCNKLSSKFHKRNIYVTLSLERKPKIAALSFASRAPAIFARECDTIQSRDSPDLWQLYGGVYLFCRFTRTWRPPLLDPTDKNEITVVITWSESGVRMHGRKRINKIFVFHDMRSSRSRMTADQWVITRPRKRK